MVLDFAVEFDRQERTILSQGNVGVAVVMLPSHERVYFETEEEAEDWLELFRVMAPDCYNFNVTRLRESN